MNEEQIKKGQSLETSSQNNVGWCHNADSIPMKDKNHLYWKLFNDLEELYAIEPNWAYHQTIYLSHAFEYDLGFPSNSKAMDKKDVKTMILEYLEYPFYPMTKAHIRLVLLMSEVLPIKSPNVVDDNIEDIERISKIDISKWYKED